MAPLVRRSARLAAATSALLSGQLAGPAPDGGEPTDPRTRPTFRGLRMARAFVVLVLWRWLRRLAATEAVGVSGGTHRCRR